MAGLRRARSHLARRLPGRKNRPDRWPDHPTLFGMRSPLGGCGVAVQMAEETRPDA